MTDDTNSESQRLEDALSQGALPDLPPNQPKGLLGGQGLDLYAVDTFEPDLNAGVSQENDGPVIRLAIVLCFLLLPPVGYWLLWKATVFTRTQKWVIGLLGTAWLIMLLWLLLRS